MSDYIASPDNWALPIALGLFVLGGVFGAGFATGRVTAPTTLSTMEAVISRPGNRWIRDDMLRYCSESGYMHPSWPATPAGAEILEARDGADVATLVCYWNLKR